MKRNDTRLEYSFDPLMGNYIPAGDRTGTLGRGNRRHGKKRRHQF
jgi:hypothetical protein